MAVVLGTKKETGTGVATESEYVTENVTEKILQVGKVRECLEDAENTPGAGRGTRNAHGNGTGTEITETDTANLVSFPFNLCNYWIYILFHPSECSIIGVCFIISSIVGFLSTSYHIELLCFEVYEDHNRRHCWKIPKCNRSLISQGCRLVSLIRHPLACLISDPNNVELLSWSPVITVSSSNSNSTTYSFCISANVTTFNPLDFIHAPASQLTVWRRSFLFINVSYY